jgi:prevent-host-death family protein
MKSMSAKDAKNGFGLLLDTARAEPVLIEKHGRPVVVVMSIETFEQMGKHNTVPKGAGRNVPSRRGSRQAK